MSWLVALFARLALLVVWIATPLVNRAFSGGWLWVVLAFFLDLAAHSFPTRQAARARSTRVDSPSQPGSV
jgi:hypothetical protein